MNIFGYPPPSKNAKSIKPSQLFKVTIICTIRVYSLYKQSVLWEHTYFKILLSCIPIGYFSCSLGINITSLPNCKAFTDKTGFFLKFSFKTSFFFSIKKNPIFFDSEIFETLICFRGVFNLNCYMSKKVHKKFYGFKSLVKLRVVVQKIQNPYR